MKNTIAHKDTWNGTHEGVSYEIQFWGKTDSEYAINEGNGMWNYYILINENMLSEEDFAKVWLPVSRWMDRSSGRKTPIYDTYESILESGDFHGGITHYSKHQCPDTGFRYIKVGCDYGHLWDMEAGYPYTLESVEQDALATVRALTKVLRFKRHCFYIGTWQYPEEMITLENGNLISIAGNEARLKNAA